MKEKIYELVSRFGVGVSFVELEQIEGVRGDLEFFINKNTVIWAGISQEFIDALNELFKEKRLVPFVASPLVYLVDGKALKLPITTSVTKVYKKPHWLPVTLCTTDFCLQQGMKIRGLKL